VASTRTIDRCNSGRAGVRQTITTGCSRRRAEASESGLNAVLERNIETLAERRRHEALSASTEERIANAITRFTGTMVFVYAHLMLVGAWLYLNLVGVPGIARFDPSLVFLATFASVEAIFLSTFVLISQNG
jgi:uncharacterized membrane protein